MQSGLQQRMLRIQFVSSVVILSDYQLQCCCHKKYGSFHLVMLAFLIESFTAAAVVTGTFQLTGVHC